MTGFDSPFTWLLQHCEDLTGDEARAMVMLLSMVTTSEDAGVLPSYLYRESQLRGLPPSLIIKCMHVTLETGYHVVTHDMRIRRHDQKPNS